MKFRLNKIPIPYISILLVVIIFMLSKVFGSNFESIVFDDSFSSSLLSIFIHSSKTHLYSNLSNIFVVSFILEVIYIDHKSRFWYFRDILVFIILSSLMFWLLYLNAVGSSVLVFMLVGFLFSKMMLESEELFGLSSYIYMILITFIFFLMILPDILFILGKGEILEYFIPVPEEYSYGSAKIHLSSFGVGVLWECILCVYGVTRKWSG